MRTFAKEFDWLMIASFQGQISKEIAERIDAEGFKTDEELHQIYNTELQNAKDALTRTALSKFVKMCSKNSGFQGFESTWRNVENLIRRNDITSEKEVILIGACDLVGFDYEKFVEGTKYFRNEPQEKQLL